MNSIQQPEMNFVGATDRESTNIESSEPSTYADKEHDLEASQTSDEESQKNLNGPGEQGASNEERSTNGDPPSTKDFPDLAPSKSMEFPDGSSNSRPRLIDRWNESMVNSCWWISLSLLFVRYTKRLTYLIVRLHQCRRSISNIL
jgi:hypothetical protein